MSVNRTTVFLAATLLMWGILLLASRNDFQRTLCVLAMSIKFMLLIHHTTQGNS